MTDGKGNRFVGMVLTESTKNNPGGHNQSSQDYKDGLSKTYTSNCVRFLIFHHTYRTFEKWTHTDSRWKIFLP